MSLDYLGILDHVHRSVVPRRYVEIGVQHGYSLALALPCTTVVGVDPQPVLLAALGDNVHVESRTSDDFFDHGHADQWLDDQPIDFAFIDGLHLFEFALRDFCNIERRCHRDSVVILDDCLPRSREEASRTRTTVGWAGDVWRVLECLRVERPDLDITVIRSAPTGLVLIRGLDPTSRSLDSRDQGMLDRYLAIDFDTFQTETLSTLTVINAEWELIEPLLPAPMQTIDDVDTVVRQRGRTRADIRTLLRRASYWALHTRVGVRVNAFRRSMFTR